MREYIEPIKNALSMREVLERYGVDVDRSGFAHCPFHQGDRNASLKCYEHSFNCFGCGCGGNQIVFVQKLFQMSFSDAMQKINEDFNLGLPIGRKTTLREQQIYARKYREFLAKRAAENEEKEAADAHREKLWDEWCFCDRAKREAAPDSLAYEQACKRIDYVAYLIDCLSDRG